MYTPAHRHIVQPHATTHTTPEAGYVEYSARDFQLSVALFSTLLNREVIAYLRRHFPPLRSTQYLLTTLI